MEGKQRINNRLLSFIFGMMIIAGNLFAQPQQRGGNQNPPPLPDSFQIVKMVDEMAKAISLAEKQKSQVSELHFDHFAKAKALMEENKKDHERHREAMDDLRKDFDEQIKNLLTEEQVEEFDKFVKIHQKQHRRNRPRRR